MSILRDGTAAHESYAKLIHKVPHYLVSSIGLGLFICNADLLSPYNAIAPFQLSEISSPTLKICYRNRVVTV
jgi:hypothetical protein